MHSHTLCHGNPSNGWYGYVRVAAARRMTTVMLAWARQPRAHGSVQASRCHARPPPVHEYRTYIMRNVHMTC